MKTNPGRLQEILSHKLYLLLALLVLANLAGTVGDPELWKINPDDRDCDSAPELEFAPAAFVTVAPGQPAQLTAKSGETILQWRPGETPSWYTVQITPAEGDTADVKFSPTDKLTSDVEGQKHTVSIIADAKDMTLKGHVYVIASGLPFLAFDSNPLIMNSGSPPLGTRAFVANPGPDPWTFEIVSMSSGLTVEDQQADTSSFFITLKSKTADSGTQEEWMIIKASAGADIGITDRLWVLVNGD